MAKRKMVQNNLLKNSISAYFAAIEIHNKPNISYRYETTTLLIMNAWELALKCFVKKYIKSKSIYTEDGHTFSINKAIEDGIKIYDGCTVKGNINNNTIASSKNYGIFNFLLI